MSQSDKLSQHLWGVHLDSEMQLLLSLSLSPRLVSKFIFSRKFMTNLQTETSPMMFELRHFCLQLDGALGLLDLFLCAFVQPKGDETRPNQGRMPDTIAYDILIGKI